MSRLFEGVTKKSMAKDIASRTYWAAGEKPSKDATFILFLCFWFEIERIWGTVLVRGHQRPHRSTRPEHSKLGFTAKKLVQCS
jgi:hypothetical protein